MHRCWAMLGLLVTACGVDLRLAPDLLVICDNDADCPAGLTCNGEAGRCVAAEDAGPLLISQVAATSSFRVVVVFNKPLSPQLAASAEHYRVSPGIVIDEVEIDNDDTVVLHVSELKARTYELTVSGLTDIFGYAIADSDARAEFVGIGDVVNPTPPELLVPLDKTNFVSGGEVTLQWTPVLEAEAYFVTVAYDASFTRLHPSTPADGYFATTEPTLTITLEAERAYFWKVTSNANEGESSTGRYAAVANEIYVYCPPDDPCDEPPAPLWEAGTRDLPFASPARAVAAANAVGASTVKVAGRAVGAYDGGMLLRGAISVLGGWDPTFTTRDPEAYATLLTADTLALQVIENSGPVLVDGLVLEARAGGTAALLANCDATVVLSHCGFTATGNDSLALDIDTSPGGGPFVRDSVIQGSVMVRGVTSPVFERDTFRGTDFERLSFVGGTRGVIDHSVFAGTHIESQEGAACADLRISNNVMTSVGDGALQLGGIFCGSVEVVNNLIWSGSSINFETQAYGIRVVGDDSATPALRVAHNTIVVAGGQVAAPLDVLGTSTIVTNNLFVCINSPSGAGIYTRGDGFILQSVENNGFVGCPSAVTVENTPAPSFVYITEEDLEAVDGGGSTGERFLGNVVSGLTPDDMFVDFAGADGLPDTLFVQGAVEDDWRLALDALGMPNRDEQLRLVSGGKDTSGSTCGTYDAPVSCGNVTTDFAATARSAPASIGAYERDP